MKAALKYGWVVYIYVMSLILSEGLHHLSVFDVLHHENVAGEIIMWDDVIYWFTDQLQKTIASFCAYYYTMILMRVIKKRYTRYALHLIPARSGLFALIIINGSWLYDELSYMCQWSFRLLNFDNTLLKFVLIITVIICSFVIHSKLLKWRMIKLLPS